MGVKSGGKTLHSVSDMTFIDLVEVLKGHAKEQGSNRPKVVVDCNNLVYIFSKASSIAEAVTNHLMKFAKEGIIMVPVVDGVRPICKQATSLRIAKMEKKRIKAFLLRKDLREANKRLVNEQLNDAERTALQEEIKSLERKFKSNETQARSILPPNFTNDLERELEELDAHTPNDKYGYVAKVVVGQFQADAYMAGCILRKEATMVMTTDSDIPIIAGDCCIAINQFTKNFYRVRGTSASNIKSVMQLLPKESKAKFNPAEFPFFDGVKYPRLRALIMVLLGCDVYADGMKGVKTKKLSDLIKDLGKENVTADQDLYLRLFHQFKTKNKLPHEVVDTLIDGLLYEPTNEVINMSNSNDLSKRTYLFGPPDKLPKYLEEFATDDTFAHNSIYPGPDMRTCKGVGDRTHLCLEGLGVQKCSKCEENVCKECHDKKDGKTYCLSCFAVESIVPLPDSMGSKTIAAMRQELKDVYNFDDVDSLSSDEVEDVYEMMEFMRMYRKLESTVPFPLYETAEMDCDTPTKWDQLMEIDFKEGGTFLAEPNLDPKHVPGLLSLFASLVEFESGKKTEWIKDAAVYDTLPALFIKFADGSRVDSGYRLLMRCIRHAFDSKTPSLDKNTAMLILHQGDVGIHLNANIPASMEKKVYQTGIAVTSTDILCCKCTCQCGSQGKERIVCVHNLPLLMLLTLLLFEALAEHILLELAACMSAEFWDKSVWSDHDIDSMKQSIITLMEAAGEPVGKHNYEKSIDDLLSRFFVGTEQRKKWKQRIRAPPKPSELCPINKVKFFSSAKIAKCATKRRIDCDDSDTAAAADDNVQADTSDTLEPFVPNYHRVTLLMDAAGCESVDETGFIGFRLLEMRSDDQATEMNRRDRTALTAKVTKDWNELERLAKKRSIRGIDTKLNNLQKSKLQKQLPTHRLPSNKASKQPSLSQHRHRPGQNLPLSQQKVKKKRVSIRCAKCKNNNINSPTIKFHCVPKYPAPLKYKIKPTRSAVIQHQGRILLHRETMDRVCGDRNCKAKKYVCDEHTFEVVTRGRKFKYNDELVTQAYRLTVPSGAGAKSTSSPTKTMSKGIGRDRAVRRIICEANEHYVEPSLHAEAIELDVELAELEVEECETLHDQVRNLEMRNIVKDAQLELAKANLLQSNRTIQQMSEHVCTESHIPINPSLLNASGMDIIRGNAKSVVVESKGFFHCNVIRSANARHFAADEWPVISLGESNKEVKRRTGFPTEKALLSYVFVVCNGDIDVIKQRRSSLTWYEEWFLHFEFIWGRSLTRFIDLHATYGIYDVEIRKVISAKYKIESQALASWPKYATFAEDEKLRKPRWNRKYKGLRAVMHDMTNISAYEFTDADLQRLTYNQYYGENCFKGGIHTQLCGWHGVEDLWLGAVSDSDYNRRAGYLDKQTEFQSVDLVEGEIVPFLNIYDKGYRAKMAALRNGKQLVLQPDWAKSDEKFNRIQTISSASVASDRGGNERSVNVCKRAGFIRRGFKHNMCPINFNTAWKTWAFQSNFMFKPIL